MNVLEKLVREIRKGLHNEIKVVYALVYIRKHLEDLGLQNSKQYPNLYFYCNWVLHIKMDHSPARKILQRFETYISNDINFKTRVDKKRQLKNISNEFIINEAKFYLFIDLNKEMKKFYIENNLPLEMLRGKQWTRFIYKLVEILKDCPLVNDAGTVYRFAYEEGVDRQIRFKVHIKNLGSFKITLREVTDKFIKTTMRTGRS